MTRPDRQRNASALGLCLRRPRKRFTKPCAHHSEGMLDSRGCVPQVLRRFADGIVDDRLDLAALLGDMPGMSLRSPMLSASVASVRVDHHFTAVHRCSVCVTSAVCRRRRDCAPGRTQRRRQCGPIPKSLVALSDASPDRARLAFFVELGAVVAPWCGAAPEQIGVDRLRIFSARSFQQVPGFTASSRPESRSGASAQNGAA